MRKTFDCLNIPILGGKERSRKWSVHAQIHNAANQTRGNLNKTMYSVTSYNSFHHCQFKLQVSDKHKYWGLLCATFESVKNCGSV